MGPLPAAYAFESDLSLREMLDALNDVAPWSWRHNDSESLGAYISAYPPGAGASRLKIVGRAPSYAIDICFLARDTNNRMTREELEQLIRSQLFPAIHARNVRETESL